MKNNLYKISSLNNYENNYTIFKFESSSQNSQGNEKPAQENKKKKLRKQNRKTENQAVKKKNLGAR
jgi:hypothetical protein